MGGSPSTPQVTQDQLDLEAMQKTTSAKLDAQENDRRKRLLNAAEGVRAYGGSPLFRSRPSNTAGGNTTSDAPVRSTAAAFVPTPVSGGSNQPGGIGSYVANQTKKSISNGMKLLNPFSW